MTKEMLRLFSDILGIIAFILLIIVLLKGGFSSRALKIAVIVSMGVSAAARIADLIVSAHRRKE